jgi:hypothetical protein
MFTITRNRRALIASLVVMFMQQFCGVNILVMVSAYLKPGAEGL